MTALCLIFTLFLGLLSNDHAEAHLSLVRNSPMNIQEASKRDGVRADYLIRKAQSLEFPVRGDSLIYYEGLYSTVVQLGTPPRNFTVQVDTSTAVTWVACTNKNRSRIGTLYRPAYSSTSKYIKCLDKICQEKLIAAKHLGCISDTLCAFMLNYSDGSTASGFYVQDKIQLKSLNSQDVDPSADLVFGCSVKRYDAMPTHGILGLSPDSSSLISQLHSQGRIADAFCHCFNGNYKNGTGFLLFDNPMLSNASFTKLIPARNQYTVKLISVKVGSFNVFMDPSVEVSSKTECIVDSGMNTGFLIANAFDVLSGYLSDLFGERADQTLLEGHVCFKNTSVRYMNLSPGITFNFDGGSSIELGPQDYLMKNGNGSICLALQRSEYSTILGDIALKDKIVVYDLKNQLIGWQDYNCSIPLKSDGQAYLSGGGWWFTGRLVRFMSFMIYAVFVV